jgi:predicted transcriptional regulator
MEPESDIVSEADSVDGLGDSDEIVFSLLKGAESHKGGVDSRGEDRSQKEAGSRDGGEDAHKPQNDTRDQNVTNDNKDTTSSYLIKIKGHGGSSNMVDSSTQTEEEYFTNTATPNAPLPQLRSTTLKTTATPQLTASQLPQSLAQAYKLPQMGTTQPAKKVTIPSSKESAEVRPSLRLLEASSISEPNKTDALQLVRFPSAKRPLSAFISSLPEYKAMIKPQHTRSYSADGSYPPHVRTAQATRRLMTLYNGFNRSEVMKKFHEQYSEKAPDLREYSIREGKRHVICGSNAYYFH